MSLLQAQLDIEARLNAVAYFADVPVYAVRTQSQASKFKEALGPVQTKSGGKSGVAVSIAMPELRTPNANLPGPQGNVRMLCRVIENPIVNNGVNGIGKDAESVAIEVARALHHFVLHGSLGTISSAEDTVRPDDRLITQGLVAYEVPLVAKYGIAPATKCATPTLTQDGALITMATTTAAASIYYTTDGSYPSAANGATAYTAPFNLAVGNTTLRFAAEKAGLHPSDVQQAAVTLTLNYRLNMDGGRRLTMAGDRVLLMSN